jgi:hypothetical protein
VIVIGLFIPCYTCIYRLYIYIYMCKNHLKIGHRYTTVCIIYTTVRWRHCQWYRSCQIKNQFICIGVDTKTREVNAYIQKSKNTSSWSYIYIPVWPLWGCLRWLIAIKKKYEQQHKVKLNRRVHKTGMSDFDKIQYNYAGAPDNDCEIFTIQI